MWARVDDNWWCHPKVIGLTLSARGLWITALSWSCAQRSDTVPEGFIRMVGASKPEANELLAACLWEQVEGGYRIHNWRKYQDASLSEKRAAAGRKGGIKSGESRSKPEANDEAGTRPVPSLPDPLESSSQDHSQPDDDGFDWSKVWHLIAEWKATQQTTLVGPGWLKATARNQPLDQWGKGYTFADRGKTWLDYFDVDEVQMAEMLTGRRNPVNCKKREAA